MNKLLSKFHLQQYLPLFQQHNIDFKTFLTLNGQALQSIGIINETHRNILVICIQKFSELLIAKAAINDPTLLITNDDETNHLINVEDSTEDYYESEDQSEDQSEDFDDGATIATMEAVTKVIKDEDYDIEYNVDMVKQHENDHPIVKIMEAEHSSVEGSDHESNVVQTEIVENDDILINKISRDHERHELPSYYESIKNDSSEDGKEELPSYSCSVGKVGYLMKKNEMVAEEQKANDRSWRKIYIHLRGTFNSPMSQFSMYGAKVTLALDYTKKRNVLRMRLLNGRSYLFQAPDRCEFISWVEKLQSSANISTTIDEREMPMFITLPTRRRRGVSQQQSRTCSTFNDNNRIHHSLTQMTASGLTYQHFNELAREFQVVQVVDVLPQQQLLW
ncbi:3871_t:CDS:2 [Diversispora eburnea]|uniref:3871_t:CDS:1 n=1 Tax=Diversispora eburnea TaxID=1213867 RepID=A0A9N8Z1A5_9GLOM|nr:3871_t:CDS:2 [Diversispora eburnea]